MYLNVLTYVHNISLFRKKSKVFLTKIESHNLCISRGQTVDNLTLYMAKSDIIMWSIVRSFISVYYQ